MTAATYKDNYTLDGRVPFQTGWIPKKNKISHATKLMNEALGGSHRALGELKEAMTTSDAIFAFAHVMRLNFVPDFEAAPREWTDIAGKRGSTDLELPTLYTLSRSWDSGTLGKGDPADPDNPKHVSPIVPEGTAYPLAYMRGEKAEGASLQKRGFKTDFTFEMILKDPVGYINSLPGAMLDVALDTEEFEVFSALKAGLTAANAMVGGKNPDGTDVPANPRPTRAALIQALTQLARRKRNGRYIPARGKYIILVAPGEADFVNFQIHNISLSKIQDGNLTLDVGGDNPLSRLTARESEYIAPGQWVIVPAGGVVGRRPVLDHIHLVGHEAPELRVENNTGQYIGGGTVPPFEGSFDNDSATFRIRQFTGGVLWTPEAVIWSDGSGN